MWDRLLTDCHVLTMVPAPGNPLGLIGNAAIGIHGGRIVRVGRRTELAGTRAAEVVPLGGGFVTPGLVDCHTHLVFGGTRAAEHAQRRAGASYEEIARAGGGIASTVRATAAASVTELLDQSRTPPARADARRGDDGRGQVGLRARPRVGAAPAQRRPHARPVGSGADRPDPARASRLAGGRRPRAFRRASDHRAGPDRGAAGAGDIGRRLLRGHRLHAAGNRTPVRSRRGARTSGPAPCRAIVQPERRGACCPLSRSVGRSSRASRRKGRGGDGGGRNGRGAAAGRFLYAARDAEAADRPPAQARSRDGGGVGLQSRHLAQPGAAARDEHGLQPVRADPGGSDCGHDHPRGPRAGLQKEVGSLEPGKAADLAVWRIADPAELGYWLGLMPERRIFGGQDQ